MLNFFNSQRMNKLTLYLPDSIAYANGTSYSNEKNDCEFGQLSSIEQMKWYSALSSTADKELWIMSEHLTSDPTMISSDRTISCIRALINPNNYRENIAILKVDFPQEDINQILIDGTCSTSNTLLLINTNNELIGYSDQAKCARYAAAVIDFFADKSDEAIIWETVICEGELLFVSTIAIQRADWTLVSIIPESDISATSKKMLTSLFPVALLLILASVLISKVLSSTITTRIRRLTKNIQTFSDSQFSSLVEESGSDEISILIRSYNYMIQKIQTLMKQQYKLGKAVEENRLKALQAQINPHFLYNTLDLINWLAIEKNSPEICEMIQELSTFYKLNLSHGNDYITINDEIKMIESYINIQNKKYNDRFHLSVDVPDTLRQYYILKMLLQPIVENAIVHGILEDTHDSGVISIRASEKDGAISLIINDDGIGIREQELLNLNDPEIACSNHGYGIRNIRERIQLNFGEQYGLYFHSTLHLGTSVEITIPLMQSPPDASAD